MAIRIKRSDGGLTFTAPAGVGGHVYRLQAQLDRRSSCKNAVWQFPAFGLVIGGGPPVHVTANAEPQLQIYAGSPGVLTVDGVARDNWALADDLTPSDPGGTKRLFHWASADPATGPGTWEVALSPFGPGCGAPAGLLASGVAPFAPGPLTAGKLDTSFSVDFGAMAAKLAQPPPGQPSDGDAEGPKLFGPYSPPPTNAATPHPSGVQNAPPSQPQPIPYVGVFYVRVVPSSTGGGGEALGPKHPFGCPGVSSNQVVVHYDQFGTIPGGASSLQIYKSAYFALNSPDNPLLIDASGWSTFAKLDWTTAGLVAHLVWASGGSDIDHGEWQLSSLPFKPDACTDSPGLLATGSAPFAPGPYSLGQRASPPVFDIPVGELADKLVTSKTYYLRVVPRATLGTACAAPPTNQVEMAWTATPTPSGKFLEPPPPPPPLAPLQLDFVKYQPFRPPAPAPPFCFTAIADHDLVSGLGGAADTVAWLAVAAGHGPHFAAGEQHICFDPPPAQDPSFWDQVVSAVLDIVSFPAQIYEKFKSVIPGIIGSILTQLNIVNCEEGTSCYKALYAVEEAGLTALGLPPSLPDAKAMFDDGEDYLAQQIADATPVPKEVAKLAIEKGKAAISAALSSATTAGTGFDCGSWCIADSGVRAPEVAVRVTRSSDDTSGLPTDTKVCVKRNDLYESRCAPLPSHVMPGDSFVVPMRLTPNFSGQTVQTSYQQAYNDCQNPPTQFWGNEMPCDTYANHVAVDVWETQLFAKAGTITLEANAGRSTLGQPHSAAAEVTADAQQGL